MGLEANHPPESSSEVKVAQSYTSLHHTSSEHGTLITNKFQLYLQFYVRCNRWHN
jgi:hypothetical protein